MIRTRAEEIAAHRRHYFHQYHLITTIKFHDTIGHGLDLPGKCPLTPPGRWGQGAQFKQFFLPGKRRPMAGKLPPCPTLYLVIYMEREKEPSLVGGHLV